MISLIEVLTLGLLNYLEVTLCELFLLVDATNIRSGLSCPPACSTAIPDSKCQAWSILHGLQRDPSRDGHPNS